MKLLRAAMSLVFLIACGPGIPHHDDIPKPPTPDFATALASATQAGDVKTIRAMLGPSATLGGLWFPDPVCHREFLAPGEVGGGRLDELARCLATLKLTVATRMDALVPRRTGDDRFTPRLWHPGWPALDTRGRASRVRGRP
jgi:hypothetical protein